MSIYQIVKVWEHDFTQAQQSVMIALADHADDYGYGIRPGIKRIAWKTRYEERQVRRIVAELRDSGILVLDHKHTPTRPAEYHINWEAARRRPPYTVARSADMMSGIDIADIDEPIADIDVPIADISASIADIAMSSKTSIEPSIETSNKPDVAEKRDIPTPVSTGGAQRVSVPLGGNKRARSELTFRCEFCGENNALVQTRDTCSVCDHPVEWVNSPLADIRRKKEDARQADEKARVRREVEETTLPPVALYVLKLGKRSSPDGQCRFLKGEVDRLAAFADTLGEEHVRRLAEGCESVGDRGRGLVAHLLNALSSGSDPTGGQLKLEKSAPQQDVSQYHLKRMPNDEWRILRDNPRIGSQLEYWDDVVYVRKLVKDHHPVTGVPIL